MRTPQQNRYRTELAIKFLVAMISSPPEGINRHKVDKKLWSKIALEWADAFIKETEENVSQE